MVNPKKNPNRSGASKGAGTSSTNKNTLKDDITLTTDTNEEMQERVNGFLMLCGAMSIQVDRQCFDVGTRGVLGGYVTTRIPRKAFNCNDAMYLMLQQVMDQYEQKNNRTQAVKTIYHILFFLGWSSVFLPYVTSTVPLSVPPTKFSAQVIFLLLCLSYLEGWAIHGILLKMNMWDVLKTTYRLFFLYVFVSEISYAHHLNGLPLVIVAWSFTENIKHAHGLLTSYALSPLLNNKWYQIGSSIIYIIHKAAFVITLPMTIVGEVWCVQEMINDYQFRSFSTAFILLVIYCLYGIAFFLNYINCLQVWINTSTGSKSSEGENQTS